MQAAGLTEGPCATLEGSSSSPFFGGPGAYGTAGLQLVKSSSAYSYLGDFPTGVVPSQHGSGLTQQQPHPLTLLI